MEYSPSLGMQVEEEMRIGTYTGDGTASREIDIGFTPKALWIYPDSTTPGTSQAVAITGYFASNKNGASVAWGHNEEQFKGIIENGFRTGSDEEGTGTNVMGVTYLWIASP